MLYILEDGEPVCISGLPNGSDLFKEFMSEIKNRIIACSKINDVSISTIFMGYDHRHKIIGEPILFETMIFGGKYSGYQARYRTLDEAKDGHKEVVNSLRGWKGAFDGNESIECGDGKIEECEGNKIRLLRKLDVV